MARNHNVQYEIFETVFKLFLTLPRNQVIFTTWIFGGIYITSSHYLITALKLRRLFSFAIAAAQCCHYPKGIRCATHPPIYSLLNTRRWRNHDTYGLMLGQRRRRWTGKKTIRSMFTFSGKGRGLRESAWSNHHCSAIKFEMVNHNSTKVKGREP